MKCAAWVCATHPWNQPSQAHAHTFTNTRAHKHAYTNIHTHMYVYAHIQTRAHTLMMCTHMCSHTHTHPSLQPPWVPGSEAFLEPLLGEEEIKAGDGALESSLGWREWRRGLPGGGETRSRIWHVPTPPLTNSHMLSLPTSTPLLGPPLGPPILPGTTSSRSLAPRHMPCQISSLPSFLLRKCSS